MDSQKVQEDNTHSSNDEYTAAACQMQNIPQEYHRIKRGHSSQILNDSKGKCPLFVAGNNPGTGHGVSIFITIFHRQVCAL